MKRHISLIFTLAACLILIFLLPVRADAEDAPSETLPIPFQANPLLEDWTPVIYESAQAPVLASGETSDPVTITEASESPVTLNAPVYLTEAEAAVQLRENMKQRTEAFILSVTSESYDYEAIANAMLEKALAHDGDPKGGDYLLMHLLGSGIQVAQDDTDKHVFHYYFAFQYTTTAAQEAAVDNAVASLLKSLNVSGKSDYEKVKAVYDYIRTNVTYDEAHAGDDTYLLKHTAYAALVNKTAVADGYSALLYRLLLELGVDNRIIIGETSSFVHCWNIVKLGKVYYNLDATFDAIQSEYSFFLRNSDNFPDHYRYFEYDSYEFHTDYPISATDYAPGVEGEPEYIYVWGVCGNDAYWCIDRDRNLTIFGTGATEDYRTDEAYGPVSPWIPWKEGFRQVVVEEGITYLGECSFYNMSNVKQVTLPDSLETLGGSAFSSCLGMTKLDMGNGVKVIGPGAFSGCVRLTELKIPDSVTELQAGAFSGCTGVTEIIWSKSLETISENAFGGCTALTKLDFPRNITRIEENAFRQCDGLTELTIPSHITYLSGFAECDNLKTVTFHNSHIGPNAFSGCDKLNHLVISNSITTIGEYAFHECASLNDITWGSSLIEIGQGAFSNCLGWSKLVLPEGLQIIGDNAFSSWDLLTEVTVPGSVTYLSGFSSCENLTTVNTQNNYTHIGYNAFAYCNNLKPFPIPDSVVEIGGEAFRSCPLLTEVVVPENVTHLGSSAFYDCRNLEKAVLYNSGIIDTYAFGNCFSLKELELNGDITEIGFCAFDGCKITSVAFPKTLTKINPVAFQNCVELSEIRFTGDAPVIEMNAFERVTATAYYPGGNATWTEDTFQNYGGTLTWVNGHVHELAEGDPTFDSKTGTHTWDCLTCDTGLVESCTFVSRTTQEATVNTLGIRRHTCTVCGGSYEETFLYRLYGDNRYETGFAVADALKEQLGVDKFDTIIVASGAGFADALTGSYLASVKNAPILLVNQHFIDEVANYIDFNLSDRGTVYLLGGELAVPATMETALAGHSVIRLAGQNRYETNLAILEEAGPSDEEVLICHGSGFADSLSASAVGKPILMVNRALTDAQAAYLQASSGKFVIIGGESAISPTLEAQLQEYGDTERIGGANRYQTSVMVAQRFFDDPACAVLAYGAKFPDGLCGGPLAFRAKAPLILTRDQNADTAAAYAAETRIAAGAVLGGPSLISDAAAQKILCS